MKTFQTSVLNILLMVFKILFYKRMYSIVFFILFTKNGYTQNLPATTQRKIDSLKMVLSNSNEDSIRVKVLLALASAHREATWSKLEPDYEPRFEYAKDALEVAKKINYRQGIAKAFHIIGNTFIDKKMDHLGIEHYFSAIRIWEELGDTAAAAAIYYNIGMCYSGQDNHTEALKYHLVALNLWKAVRHEEAFSAANSSVGLAYFNLGDHEKALEHFFDGLRIAEQRSDKSGIAYCQQWIGNVYAHQNKFPESLKYLFSALQLFEEIGYQFYIAGCNVHIGSVLHQEAQCNMAYPAKENYAKAIGYLNEGLNISKKIGEYHTMRDAYLALSRIYTDIKDYQNALAHTRLYHELKDSLFNKDTYRRLTELMVQYNAEKKTAEERVKTEKQKSKQEMEQTFLGIGAGVLAILVLFIVLLKRQRNLKRKAIEKANAAHKMTELELQSLRAQLNPHFMFNSLNAIQELILKEDNDNSHMYLSRFSELLRMLLDNASQPFVTLKKELNLLELYLSLEKLRISDLQYSIEVDKSIDANKIMIPNMMLQPYIENAIWHGLSQKKGEKILNIRINKTEDEIVCEVQDNGVGRKMASELQSLYRKEHRSKGMELLSKRFILLSKEYGSEIRTSIEDLHNNGTATGTKVEISLPQSLTEQYQPIYS